MNFQVFSEDDGLLAICRELCREFPNVSWRLETAADAAQRGQADLCLWEYAPGGSLPQDAPWGTRCFALVPSAYLESLRTAHPFAEPGVVLKPVTRGVIRGLMAQAAGQRDQQSLRSDRDEILQCLMQANLRLQQYDAERTNFLGRALHDFHAPLTAISGYCGLLLEDSTGYLDERQRMIIQRMRQSCRRLSRMSRAMYQLSVGRHVALKPTLRRCDLRDCADQALTEIQQLVDEKDLQVLLDFEPSCSNLLLDASQMEQVFVNLLENACKFSPRAGSIVIKGYACFNDRRAANVFSPTHGERRMRQSRTSNAYRVDIEDSGPGVAPEHLKTIFEEYVSYAGGQDRSRGGLGLAICRMILQQHQGRIWAGNSPSGAVFSFVVPIEPTAPNSESGTGSDIGGARQTEATPVYM